MNEQVCFLCFSFVKGTRNIKCTHLQSVYEKLTDTKIQADSHPLCYVCYAKLLKCNQLILKAQQQDSENQLEARPLVQLGVFNANKCSLQNDSEEVELSTIIKESDLKKEYEEKDPRSYEIEIEVGRIKLEYVENVPPGCEGERDIQTEHINTECVDNHSNQCEEQIAVKRVEDKPDPPALQTQDSKPFSCNICSKKFTHMCRLKVHEQVHADVKPHCCDICNKTFTQSGNLKAHKLIHNGEKLFGCDICDKKFARMNSLKRHKLLHTGDQPYSCNICSRKFTHSSSLRTHKLTHSDEKLYTCDECGEKFTHLTMLKRHKLIHSDDNPYTCERCNEKFAHSTGYKNHLLRHRGKKLYTCEVCCKPFLSRANLNQHKKIHSNDNPHTCDVCSKVFSRSDHLRRHKLTHQTQLLVTFKQPYFDMKCPTKMDEKIG